MPRNILIDRVLADPAGNTIKFIGRMGQDCICSFPDCALAVELRLGAAPNAPITGQVWVLGEADTAGYIGWTTTLTVPAVLGVCGQTIAVRVTGSDSSGPCAPKDDPDNFTINCCPEVVNITASAGTCLDNGANCRVTVTFDILRHNLAGAITAKVTLRRPGSSVEFSNTSESFEEDDGGRKSCTVPVIVQAPLNGEAYFYDLQVELIPEPMRSCDKSWPLGEQVRVNACDCVPVAGELRLVDPANNDAAVVERDGPNGKCVDLARVKVVAPDPPNGDTALSWINATPVEGQRAATVEVPASGSVTVIAQIGDRCRTPLSKELRRCPSTPGNTGGGGGGDDDDDDDDRTAPTSPTTPSVPWCTLIGLAAVFLTAFGLAMAAFFFCVLNYADVILEVLLSLGLVSGGSTSVVSLIIVIVLIILILIGCAMVIAGNVLFVIWLFTCGSCKTNCGLLNDIHWLLVLVIIPIWAIITGVAALVGMATGGRPCWIGWALGILDFGILDALLLYYGAAVGCFRWPNWVPRFLRLRAPDPARFICKG